MHDYPCFLSKMRVKHHPSFNLPFKLTSRMYKLLGFAQIWVYYLKYIPFKLFIKMYTIPRAPLFA